MDELKRSLGLVHVYTGNGKGKTTASLGLAMRALEHGLTVDMVQFLKGGSYTGEIKAAERYPSFSIKQFGKGNDKKPHYADFTPDETDRERALRALSYAREKLTSGTDVLILDEVNVALQLKHLEISEVMSLIEEKPTNTELVLTGRNAPRELMSVADYVTEMKMHEHPYNKGILGRKGIDY